MIINDFDLIVHKFPRDVKNIHLYPIGDLHIGSSEFSLEKWNYWLEKVKNDKFSKVVIVGDMIDNGLKNSKTLVYGATMRPKEQKKWVVNQLMPIKDKIIGSCTGNHEFRSVNETDNCPLYDIMCKLDLEHIYRENMCFIKINLGDKNKDRQYSYTIVLGHGKSRSKTAKFSYVIDGMDVLITGHTHSPESNFPSKIVIDSKNEIVKLSDYCTIVVPSFAKFGGYALKDMYMPQGFKIPIIELSGERKGVVIKWI